MVTQHALSCLIQLFVYDKVQLSKLACSYFNPSTWSLWRAYTWELEGLLLSGSLDSADLSRHLCRIARLSQDIASGVIPLTTESTPGNIPLLSGYSPDFKLLINNRHPADSEIVELFTGRINLRRFKFLPLCWPYPIRLIHSEKSKLDFISFISSR